MAIIGADVEALCARGRDLLDHPSPDGALSTWLRAVAVHATAMRGLVATRMAAPPADGTLAACHDAILATGTALLGRAQREGSAAEEIDVADLLRLVNSVAWASEQTPGDDLDRLLTLVFCGLRSSSAPERSCTGRS